MVTDGTQNGQKASIIFLKTSKQHHYEGCFIKTLKSQVTVNIFKFHLICYF